jgi:hypothetical protein
VFLNIAYLSGNLFKSYEEVGIMDKRNDHILGNHANADHNSVKRPRWLTLCMMVTAASVIVLAGCGDNEEVAPPAEETAPLEQDTTAEPATGMNDDPAMEQDPGLSEAPAEQESMTQPESTMPEDTLDEPAEGVMDPDEEAGFGEGTDPMPGAEDNDEEMNTQ